VEPRSVPGKRKGRVSAPECALKYPAISGFPGIFFDAREDGLSLLLALIIGTAAALLPDIRSM
jgi:hypothetical protein